MALNLPLPMREEIVRATAPLREAAPELAWIDAPRLHLTLKFLGEQPDGADGAVMEVLAEVAARHRPFVLDLNGIGAFPNFRRARVVWLGVAPEPRLELLQHDVERFCERIGHAVEGRPFRPHLTLARVRKPLPEETLRALARAARSVSHHTEVDVSSIDLMRSTLDRRGARYELVRALTLGTGTTSMQRES